VCLAVLGVETAVFDYYKRCDKTKKWLVYWPHSLLIGSLAFGVQVVIPYRLMLGERLFRKYALLLWFLCVLVRALCKAKVRYHDVPNDDEEPTDLLSALANDIMSWVVVPVCLYFIMGIRGFTGPYRCARVSLLAVTILVAIVIDTVKFSIPTMSPYDWKPATIRSLIILVFVSIYCYINRKTDPNIFRGNPVNQIELATLYNLLQGVLNDLSYVLKYIVKYIDQFDSSIWGISIPWFELLVLFGYTAPMLFLTFAVEKLIKDRTNDTTKRLLIFAFTFFQAYLTAIWITSMKHFNFISLLILVILILIKTSIVYARLVGYCKVFMFISAWCPSLSYFRKRNSNHNDDRPPSTNLSSDAENIQEQQRQSTFGRLFNPQHLTVEHESVAMDMVLERIGAFACYGAAVWNLFIVNSAHPADDSQATNYQNTYKLRVLICCLWFFVEIIILLIFIILLRKFQVKMKDIRKELYSISSWSCLFCFMFIILLYCIHIDVTSC
jgi:hypothetical protein